MNYDPNTHQENLNQWGNSVKSNTEQDFAREIFKSILLANEKTEDFVNWYLGVLGVMFALGIGNFGAILTNVPTTILKLCLLYFLAAVIFAFISKFIGVFIARGRVIAVTLEKELEPVFKRYWDEVDKIKGHANPYISIPDTELDMNLVLKKLTKPFNFLEARSMKRGLNQGKQDPLSPYTGMIYLARWQFYLLALSILSLLICCAPLFWIP